MDWFRWHHGTAADPKWRVVAADSGEPLAFVLAVWAAMLECASQAEERGRLDGWNDRVIAVSLGMSTEQVSRIRDAMQGLTLDGDRLSGWERRQPKRERDDLSTDRVRAHRERQANKEGPKPPDGGGNASETPRNATEHLDKNRGDKSREEKEGNARASAPPDPEAIWFEGDAVRLNHRDFAAWGQRFSEAYPDLWGELWIIDGKLAAEGLSGSKAFLKAERWLQSGLERWRKQRAPPADTRMEATV